MLEFLHVLQMGLFFFGTHGKLNDVDEVAMFQADIRGQLRLTANTSQNSLKWQLGICCDHYCEGFCGLKGH